MHRIGKSTGNVRSRDSMQTSGAVHRLFQKKQINISNPPSILSDDKRREFPSTYTHQCLKALDTDWFPAWMPLDIKTWPRNHKSWPVSLLAERLSAISRFGDSERWKWATTRVLCWRNCAVLSIFRFRSFCRNRKNCPYSAEVIE